jgi:hypothetical protein
LEKKWRIGTALSERWIQVSEKIIEQLNHLDETKDKDRLELVRSLHFVLGVLQRSLVGWTQWVNNPDIMSIFTREDLEQMMKKLSEFTKSFVKYDLELTNLGIKKGLKAPKKIKNKREERTDRFYV